jgi:hypothetical protein
MFAFTVDGLVPPMLSPFVINMAQRFIVENFGVKVFLPSILSLNPATAKYTSVIHLESRDGNVVGKKYVWAQKDVRPWGTVVPSQCVKCLSFRSFGVRQKSGKRDFMECGGIKMNGSPCLHQITFEPPAGQKSVPGAPDWLMFDWP